MKWLSKEDERKVWIVFWKSFWYPTCVWFICILFIFSISYLIVTFPEKINRSNIFEEVWVKFNEIIPIIPSGVNFQISIITMSGTLILTLFVNSRNENTWSSPREYIRKSAYRKYIWLITHFLGSVWFLSFLCKVSNMGINSDVPAWLFLFLSWFVLSIYTHIDKTDISVHNKVMSSYRDLVKLEMENKYLGEVSVHVYEIHTQNKAINKWAWYNRMLKKIIPGTMKSDKLTSLIGYSSGIMGGVEKSRIKNFVKQFTVLMGQILLSISIQILVLWLLFWLVYRVELNLNSNSVSQWIATIICGLFISGYYLVAVRSHMVNWRISSKIYPKNFKNIMEHLGWIILCYLCFLMLQYMVIISLVLSFTSNREQSSYVDFLILIILIVVLFIFPFLEILFYIKRNLDKNIENFDYMIINVFQSLYSESTKKKLDLVNGNINIYKIAMSVYLRMFSYESYRDYIYSLGKDVGSIDIDLEDAYEKAKKDFE